VKAAEVAAAAWVAEAAKEAKEAKAAASPLVVFSCVATAPDRVVLRYHLLEATSCAAAPPAPDAAPPSMAARREQLSASSAEGAPVRREEAIELVSGSGAPGEAAEATVPDSLEELYSLVGTHTYSMAVLTDCGYTYYGSICWWAHCTDQGWG